jgi:hypothetical protein
MNTESVPEHTVTALAPSSALPAVALSPRRETFAQRYAAHGSAVTAYREAFNPTTASPATVRQRAYEMAHEPAVAERTRQLLAVAAEGTTVSAKARMVALQTICEADPGELVRVVAEACPACHGPQHAPLWRSVAAFEEACEHAARTGKRAPVFGGLGYDPSAPPVDTCPDCRGEGITRVVVTPTDKLSPAARRLLKGIRQKANGEIEVRMHDTLAAADMLNRMQGSYVDRSVSVNINANIPAPKDMTTEQALACVERVLSGSRTP